MGRMFGLEGNWKGRVWNIPRFKNSPDINFLSCYLPLGFMFKVTCRNRSYLVCAFWCLLICMCTRIYLVITILYIQWCRTMWTVKHLVDFMEFKSKANIVIRLLSSKLSRPSKWTKVVLYRHSAYYYCICSLLLYCTLCRTVV